jgi:hypothetical protein
VANNSKTIIISIVYDNKRHPKKNKPGKIIDHKFDQQKNNGQITPPNLKNGGVFILLKPKEILPVE